MHADTHTHIENAINNIQHISPIDDREKPTKIK